jgi:hypothetical protein
MVPGKGRFLAAAPEDKAVGAAMVVENCSARPAHCHGVAGVLVYASRETGTTPEAPRLLPRQATVLSPGSLLGQRVDGSHDQIQGG